MPRLLRALNFDLVVEQQGHKCRVEGTGERPVVTVGSFSSLLHFARLRNTLLPTLPAATTVQIRWWIFRWNIRGSKILSPPWNL
jgi:hypothetical protein